MRHKGLPKHTCDSISRWCSPASLLPPLLWCLAKPCRIATLLHHHHAIVLLLDGVFLNLSLSPCWIKAWETSPGCTCVERGGAVRSALGHRRFGSRRVRLHQPRSLERFRLAIYKGM